MLLFWLLLVELEFFDVCLLLIICGDLLWPFMMCFYSCENTAYKQMKGAILSQRNRLPFSPSGRTDSLGARSCLEPLSQSRLSRWNIGTGYLFRGPFLFRRGASSLGMGEKWFACPYVSTELMGKESGGSRAKPFPVQPISCCSNSVRRWQKRSVIGGPVFSVSAHTLKEHQPGHQKGATSASHSCSCPWPWPWLVLARACNSFKKTPLPTSQPKPCLDRLPVSYLQVLRGLAYLREKHQIMHRGERWPDAVYVLCPGNFRFLNQNKFLWVTWCDSAAKRLVFATRRLGRGVCNKCQ